MNFVFSIVFFAVWPGGRRCANCRDVHFFWEVLWWKHLHMKNIQNNNGKKKKKQKKQKVQTHGQGLGRGLAGDMGLNFFFFWGGFPWFFAVWPKPREHKKKQKKNKKFRPMGKVWAIHTQTKKNKKTKKQKTKKPKNQKNKKPKNQKNQDCTPQGEGVRCRVLGLVFLVFLFFLVFWFFGLCVDSHCRCAKQRLPGTVSGCTRSKVDTLQYSNVCYDIVHSANEQQRGMEFNFVRLRHMLLDLCTGNAAICALPQWPVLFIYPHLSSIHQW